MNNDYIKLILQISAIGWMISAILYTFIQPANPWLWFSRAALSVVCFGFYAIVKAIENIKK